MWYFIKHPVFGYFVGEFAGMAVFEHHLKDTSKARPFIFPSQEAAEEYIGTWDYGGLGCYVTEEIPQCYLGGVAA